MLTAVRGWFRRRQLQRESELRQQARIASALESVAEELRRTRQSDERHLRHLRARTLRELNGWHLTPDEVPNASSEV